MRNTLSTGKTGTSSPLALDLALNRMGLAAIKTKSSKALTDEERIAATQLAEYYKKQLETTGVNPGVSSKLVPEEETRTLLEKTLATLRPVRAPAEECDTALLRDLVELLSELGHRGRLGAQEADQLLSDLRRIESKSKEKTRRWARRIMP